MRTGLRMSVLSWLCMFSALGTERAWEQRQPNGDQHAEHPDLGL